MSQTVTLRQLVDTPIDLHAISIGIIIAAVVNVAVCLWIVWDIWFKKPRVPRR